MDANIIIAAIFIGIVSGFVGAFIANCIYERHQRYEFSKYDYAKNFAGQKDRKAENTFKNYKTEKAK